MSWRRRAQEEGAGSELFVESQDDENEVEVDGEKVFEEDLEEALPPAVVRDLGASTETEIAEHSLIPPTSSKLLSYMCAGPSARSTTQTC